MAGKKVKNSKKTSIDSNKYNSQIAQIIESSGNFFSNNSSNLGHIIVFIVIIGGGFFLYKGPSIIANSIRLSSTNTNNSINTLSEKVNNLFLSFIKQEDQNSKQIEQNSKQIELLNQILQEQKKHKER